MASINTLARVATVSVARAPATSRRIATASAAPARRFLSTTTSEAAAASEKPSPPSPPPPQPTPSPETSSGGSSFLQRVAAFLTGAGVGCGVGYYHLSTVRRMDRPVYRLGPHC
ncbi:hypothetical protein Esi_1554_0001 [Ectocarpus siliculosus]|uniref:Uncharacterized protein n=1 Tax=Ectocarpus siliculosus TaxID=2880 RepID=D7FL85_ECTSI|nr:hypothetical protein Esi_1554_0001 [Ectocarpus siliculosus]|eukprot:CBJ34225.1 hypothetical protein Esi_1554_0001 [Ectocarpus siliculosus]